MQARQSTSAADSTLDRLQCDVQYVDIATLLFINATYAIHDVAFTKLCASYVPTFANMAISLHTHLCSTTY